MTHVRCYAGASYPERPTAFEWQGRWLEVTEIISRARTPEGLLFNVQTADKRRYRLRWVEDGDEWDVARLREEPVIES